MNTIKTLVSFAINTIVYSSIGLGILTVYNVAKNKDFAIYIGDPSRIKSDSETNE